MTTVVLHGNLKEQFGGPYDLSISSAAEAFRALFANFPKMREVVREGHYQIVAKKPKVDFPVDEDTFHMQLGNSEVHIVPSIDGAGKGGIGKVIAGVVIIALSVVTAGAAGAFAAGAAGMSATVGGATAAAAGTLAVSYATVASIGVSIALAGVAQMMSPSPTVSDYGAREAPDQRASFLFNGPVNAAEQGGPVPLVYGGPIRVGSVAISSSLDSEQI